MRKWIDIVSRKALSENIQEFPARVDATFLVRWLTQNHHSPEDIETGDLYYRVASFSHYDLRKIPLSELNPDEWYVDDNLVAQYEYLHREGTVAPPIIYDPVNRSIIDGTHRVNTALKTGETEILAYVGDPDTYDRVYPEDDEDDEDEWHTTNEY